MVARWKALKLLVRVLLGGLFVWSAWLKLRDPLAFARAVNAYRLIPWEATNLVAFGLPWLELVTGLALGSGLWVRASALLVSVQLGLYSLAIGWALQQGLEISCGCLGLGSETVSADKLLSNLLLLAVALAFVVWPGRPAAPAGGENQPPSTPRL